MALAAGESASLTYILVRREIPPAGTPDTGDPTNLWLLVCLFLGAGGAAVVLVVYGHRSKRWIALVLCLVMTLGMVPVSTLAAQTQAEEKTVTASATVTVDGKPLELTARVCYTREDVPAGPVDPENPENPEDRPTGIGFRDGVTQKEAPFDWETVENTAILPENEAVPEVGQIITFGTETAIKVEAVEEIDGDTVITYSTPEMGEYLKYINIQGTAAFDREAFGTIEGVTVTETEAPAVRTRSVRSGDVEIPDTEFNPNVKFEVNLEEMELTKALKLQGGFSHTIERVAYKLDLVFDDDSFLPTVHDAYVEVESNTTVTLDLKESDEIKKSLKPVELFSIPMVGTDGLGIVLKPCLVTELEGSIYFDYQLDGILGVRVDGEKVENISSLQSRREFGAKASLKAGAELAVAAELFNKDILRAGVGAGIEMETDMKGNDLPGGVWCLDAKAEPYAELNLLKNCEMEKWLKKLTKLEEVGLTIDLIDALDAEKLFPPLGSIHIENFKIVPECTYENGAVLTGTVTDAVTGDPVAGAVLQIVNRKTHLALYSLECGQNGSYEVAVPAGELLVRASAPGYLPKEETVVVQDDYDRQVNLALSPEDTETDESGTIAGTVIGRRTKQPLPEAQILVYAGWDVTEGSALQEAAADENGQYTLTLPVGNYTLVADAESYQPGSINVMVTPSGMEGQDILLDPDPNKFFAGYEDRIGGRAKYFELQVSTMTPSSISGYLQVSSLFKTTHATIFTGEGVADGGNIVYTITYSTPLDMIGGSHDTDTLIYDTATGRFHLTGFVYDAVLLPQPQSDELILTDCQWEGQGSDEMSSPTRTDIDFILTVDEMREQTIQGSLLVEMDGATMHSTDFTGRGYAVGGKRYYEVSFDTPRLHYVGSIEIELDALWLIYDPGTGNMTFDIIQQYDCTMRQVSGEQPGPAEGAVYVGYRDITPFVDPDRYQITIASMDDTAISGNLNVSKLYATSEDVGFTGTGTLSEDGTQVVYRITYEEPVTVNNQPVAAMDVTYDKTADTFRFDNQYYVTLKPYRAETPLVLAGGTWTGMGDDTLSHSVREFEYQLHIDQMFEESITGTLTLLDNGVAYHTSTFTGRGAIMDGAYRYEFRLDNPREVYNFVIHRVEFGWLLYDPDTDTFALDATFYTAKNLTR